MSREEEILEKIKESFGDDVKNITIKRSRRMFAETDAKHLKEFLRYARHELEFDHLSAITGEDLGDEIELIYHIAYQNAIELSIKIKVPRMVDTPFLLCIICIVRNILPPAVYFNCYRLLWRYRIFKKYQDFLLRLDPSGIVTVIGVTPEGERHILAGTAIVDLIAPSANRSFEVIRNLSEGIKLKTGLVWNDILIVAKEGAEEQCEITYREFNTSFQRELQKALSWIEKFYRGNCKQKFKYTSVIEIYPTPASFLGFITGGTIGENGVVRVETSGNSFNLAFRILHENVHLWFRSFNLTQPLLKDKELAIRSTRFFQEYWDKYRNVLLILTEICAYLEHSMFVSWILNQPQIQKETPMVKWKYVRSQRNGFLKDLNEQIDLIEEEVFQKDFFTPYGEQFFKRIKYQFQHLYRDVLKL